NFGSKTLQPFFISTQLPSVHSRMLSDDTSTIGTSVSLGTLLSPPRTLSASLSASAPETGGLSTEIPGAPIGVYGNFVSGIDPSGSIATRVALAASLPYGVS